jgi:hypothetical protein
MLPSQGEVTNPSILKTGQPSRQPKPFSSNLANNHQYREAGSFNGTKPKKRLRQKTGA